MPIVGFSLEARHLSQTICYYRYLFAGTAFRSGLCFESRPVPNRRPLEFLAFRRVYCRRREVIHHQAASVLPGGGRTGAAVSRSGLVPSGVPPVLSSSAGGRSGADESCRQESLPTDRPINIPHRPGGSGSPDWDGTPQGRAARDAHILPLTAPGHSN